MERPKLEDYVKSARRARERGERASDKDTFAEYSLDMKAYADHLERELQKRSDAAIRWYYRLRDLDHSVESEKADLPHDLEAERDELKKQLAEAVDKIASYSKDADEYRAALEYAKADMREGVKGMVDKVSSARYQLTMMYDFPSKAGDLLDDALEQARKLGIVEGKG